MAIKKLVITNFSGGMSTVSSKIGPENSFKVTKNVNIFEDPAYITLAKQTAKISSSTVTALPHWFDDGSPWDTNRYAYDSGGNIYQIASDDTVTLLRTVSGGAGEGLVVHDKYLYYAQATNIGRYGPLDGTPAFTDSFTSWWLASDLQTSGGGTGSTDYSTTTSINEGTTHRQSFTADHDPITSVVIDVDVVGTGNWTLTVHDRNNVLLGSKTIANASMSTGDVAFTFDSPLRVEPGEDYHFHVTTSVADGGVDTNVNTDLEGAEFTVNYAALIEIDWHPMVRFFGGWVVGNERYIGFFDRLSGTYNPTKVKLDPGYVSRTVYTVEEYLVVEAYKGQSFSEPEDSKRYFWDGLEKAYNFSEPLNMGAPNAATSYKNTIFGVYGNRGAIYTGSKPMSKIIGEIPTLGKGETVEVYPGAITEYEERLLIGVAGSTSDGTNLEQGVYELGAMITGLPDALNLPYTISTGENKGTTVKIGAVKAFGTDLYIGWQDGNDFGIDKVSSGDNSTDEVGVLETLIFDDGDPDRIKQAIKLEAEFESLVSGDSVSLEYKIDRASSFTTGSAETATGARETNLYINEMFKEIELGTLLSTSADTYPKFTLLKFVYDDLADEGDDA